MARILIVEDDVDCADLLSMLLDAEGHAVSVARTGEAALAALAAARPDVVLMDLGLPGEVDGLEATRRMRAAEATAAVPVLLVTAFPLGEVRDAASEAGVDAVYSKPLTDLVEFAQRVARAAAEGRAA